MPDREAVIRSLINCMSDEYECSDKCQYFFMPNGCVYSLMMDAAQLLKEQEPRVLTIEEVTGDDECWFEHRNGTCGYAKCFMHKASQTVEINCIMSNPEFITLNSFMKLWRCWSAKPTDEQRRAVKWG